MPIRVGKPITKRVGVRTTEGVRASQKLVPRPATLLTAAGSAPKPKGRAVSRCPTCVRVLS